MRLFRGEGIRANIEKPLKIKIEKLEKERDLAVRVLEKLNKDISHGEHIDSSWIKDTIELNAR